MNRTALFDRLRQFPKVDLHRHLEGSISAQTLIDISARYGGALPAYTVEELRPHVQMDGEAPGFAAFLKKFLVYRGFYTCQEAIEEIACAAVAEAAGDGIKYLELRYSPSHFAGVRFKESDVIDWISTALRRSAAEHGIIVVPILTISRDYGYELAASTIGYAAAQEQGFFYGLDIAGDEAKPALPFRDLFCLAKGAGLKLTVHAGEAGGAENVGQAVLEFHADRIGHGVRSLENPEVLKLLRDRQVMLELCLTSNVHTGAVPAIEAHPIRRLMELGIPVSINSDDPAISAITLTGEYVLAVTRLGFTESELRVLNLRTLDHAFYPDREQLKKELAHYWE